MAAGRGTGYRNEERYVSISQARFLKWPQSSRSHAGLPGQLFQSLRRDSSSGRISEETGKGFGSTCFNLSGEIPQVAAPGGAVMIPTGQAVSISQARFLKWPRGREGEGADLVRLVSISQARFLKWPLDEELTRGVRHYRFQSLRRDSSSGRNVRSVPEHQKSRFQSLRRDSSSGRIVRERGWTAQVVGFNLSGEIPQVAAYTG